MECIPGYQPLLVCRPVFSKVAGSRIPFVLPTKRLDFSCKRAILYIIPRAASASSPSFTGSESEYTDQLSGFKTKPRKERIAGVDQDEIFDPAHLADPDSCFCEFRGVRIHHKVAEPPAENVLQDGTSTQSPDQTTNFGFPMILLHGFGASVFSWNRVLKPLAHVTGSKVVAFDRPAFGLTSRFMSSKHSSSGSEDTKPLNPFSTIFSVLATLYFIDFLAAEKAILVGHSAGSLVAVQACLEAPERVAALILVAPAILTPLIPNKAVKRNQDEKNDRTEDGHLTSNADGNPFIRLCGILMRFFKLIADSIVRLTKGMLAVLNSLSKKAFSALLRSAVGVMLIRMAIDKFAILAIRNSWYNANQVTDHVLQGYTKPLRVKGWDKALVEYTITLFADSESESNPPLGKRLNEISCPVLVITGDNDRLVPPWNSERLSKSIPGACFEVIEKCGHLPHEERPDEFVSIVRKFLQRVLGGSEATQVQPAAA